MPVYFYWGEDDFAMEEAIATLKKEVLDPNWIQFNYDKLLGQNEDNLRQGLNQAMTAVFGMGDRLVWLNETNICQSCTEDLFLELKRTIPRVPDSAHLLFTTTKKPDSRLKSTKLLQKYATVKEFTLIPSWQTEAIIKKVEETANQKGVKLTNEAIKNLAYAVGNNSRILANELEKLLLYQDNNNTAIDEDIIKLLVNINTQNSLELAKAIIQKDVDKALQLVNDLINLNEPALRIVATLVGQFRLWLMIKLMLESGDKKDKEIATAVDVGNPKRIYFLRQEIKGISGEQLLKSLPLLLELELSLKKGANPLMILETKVIELINIFNLPKK